MSATPIYTADELLQAAIYAALSPLLSAYQTNGQPRLYWQVAPANTVRPFVVFQLQSDVSQRHRIGRGGAETLVTLRAVADTLTAANTLRDIIANGISALSVSGYDCTVQYDRSPNIPFDGQSHQSAHIYRVYLLTQ